MVLVNSGRLESRGLCELWVDQRWIVMLLSSSVQRKMPVSVSGVCASTNTVSSRSPCHSV